jgi:FkbM family methyltransferase
MKATFGLLAGNMRDNGNVRVYNFGFGEKEGAATLYYNEKTSPMASAFKRRMEHLGVDAGYKEDVAIKTLDGFCKENNISCIDLLKIDVEGSEIYVLRGARSLIGNNLIKLIQFEFGGFNIASRTFFQDFFDLLSPNFQIYRVLKDGLEPVYIYREAHEIFLTTNYLAISRKM